MVRTPIAAPRRRVAQPPSIEQQFQKLQAQLEALKAQVRQAQQMSAMGRVAPTIAHEVSNLLTPMVGYAQMALAGEDLALMRKALLLSVKHAKMLMAMSDRLLKLSSAKPPERKSISLRGIVDEALASLCRDPSKDGVTVSIAVSESLAVRVDGLQLQQVLFNLFLNAREAMSAGHSGRLTVGAESKDGEVVLVVRNSGPPIPEDVLPHIFEPFQTTKPAERNGRARCGGLGLALCRDLIEENGGTISVMSGAEVGTTFTITLPGADESCALLDPCDRTAKVGSNEFSVS